MALRSTKENPGFSGFSPTWDLGHCNRDVRSGAVPLEHWAWAHLLYVGVFGDFSGFFLFLFFLLNALDACVPII